MKNRTLSIVIGSPAVNFSRSGADSVLHWEELTGPDFVKALDQAKGVCLLPFRNHEKHGPSGPMVRISSTCATRLSRPPSRSTRSSFPNITSARSSKLSTSPAPSRTVRTCNWSSAGNHRRDGAQWMQEGRNRQRSRRGEHEPDCLLRADPHSKRRRLRRLRDHQHSGSGGPDAGSRAPFKTGRRRSAGETEIASYHGGPARARSSGTRRYAIGRRQKRLDLPANVYTGIWWYARFPNHYQGDAAGATAARGAALQQMRSDAIASAIRAISPTR